MGFGLPGLPSLPGLGGGESFSAGPSSGDNSGNAGFSSGGVLNKKQQVVNLNETSTLGASDHSTVAGAGAVVNFLDGGAIDLAGHAVGSLGDVANNSILSGESMLNRSLSFAGDASQNALLANESVIGRSFNFAGDVSQNASLANEALTRSAFDFVTQNNDAAIRSLQTGFDTNARLISGVADKVSVDSGERVQQVTQYVLYAAVAMAALFIFGRGRRAG